MKNKNDLFNTQKIFDNKIRLAIMSILFTKKNNTFISIKETLQTSDGNLSSHSKILTKEKLITINKIKINNRITTSYFITKKGEIAFKKHIATLKKIIQNNHYFFISLLCNSKFF